MPGIIRDRIILILTVILAGCSPMVGSSPAGDRISAGSVKTEVSRNRPAAPDLIRLRNGRYRVRSAWKVELHGRPWHVTRGYTSNGITAPSRIKKSFGDGVNNPETWAAMFHDWLFTQPGVSRAQADQLFYDLLIAYGVPQAKARIMYSIVAAYSASKAIR